MKYRTPCPACDGTVGFWSVFAAATPWHVILEFAAGVGAGIAGGVATANGTQLWYPFLLALIVAGLIDVAVSLLVLNKGLLRLPK